MPSPWSMDRRQIMLTGTALMTPLIPASAAGGAPRKAIDQGAYEAYIAAFNARRMDGFLSFYAPDVRFLLGGKMELTGRAAIAQWYEAAWQRIEEHCLVRRVIVDETGLAAELETTFRAIADWPDFTAGPLRTGDVLRRIGFIHYDIAGGQFTRVATAAHRILQVPDHWAR